MWVRQCDLDAGSDFLPPIPSRIASNEEFVPPPQSDEQKAYEAQLAELSERAAKRQGRSRRDFLRSGSGMAAAMVALNQVFGDCYDVHADEVDDPKAFEERWPKDQFVFDMQTHHVDVTRKWYDDSADGRAIKAFFRLLRPEAKSDVQVMEMLNRAHYVKEVFGDSDTVMAVISGVPSRDWDRNPLPPDQMVATRKFVNDLAGSRRVLSHGLLRPNLGKPELDEMERQIKELKIEAWKMYTGAEIGEKAWRMDDEKVAYPFWEKTRALGIKNLCVHKGLPLGAFNEEACRPIDLEKAAKDWPDLNFIVYHSGFRGYGWLGKGTGLRVVDPRTNDPQEIPWVSDVLRIFKRNPDIKNIYFELGGTFAILSMVAPQVCMHMLAQMIQVAGADHVLWGTDSIWNGSPQSQIERMRRLKIADELIEKFGYPQLTPEIKDQILGLNAAKLFGIDPKAARNAIKADKLSQLREGRRYDPETRSNTQYGWVWVEDGSAPTTPVGA
ncbi:MAG: amidohydrolase family protein [Isosphaeraceae bacterium]